MKHEGPIVRRLTIYSVIGTFLLASGFPHFAQADDGIAEIGAGGIVFQKSTNVSMDNEVLEISPDKVNVSYVFSNSSGNDVTTVVAFPVPPIICDSFMRDETRDYPDNFVAYSDGKPIKFDVETRAFIRSDLGGKPAFNLDPAVQSGQEITNLLKSKSLPTDCRRLGIGDIKHDRKTHRSYGISKSYKSAVSFGLASDATADPGVVYYETRIKYYWQQSFPAGKPVVISHSYHPAAGEGTVEIPKEYYPEYFKYLDQYRRFFADHLETAKYERQYDSKKGYTYTIVKFILTTANTWHGPIKDFKLVLPKPAGLIVATLDGDISLQDGHVVVEKKNFAPTEDLSVFFIDPY